MYRKLIALFVLFSFLLCLVGCTSMKYVSREELAEAEPKSSVWVTLKDGTEYKIDMPKVEQSKLVGYVEGDIYKVIDLSEIESYRVKEPDTGKTMIWGVLGITGAIVLIWGLTKGGGSGICST